MTVKATTVLVRGGGGERLHFSAFADSGDCGRGIAHKLSTEPPTVAPERRSILQVA